MNLSRVILCREMGESLSLYVHICIFWVLVFLDISLLTIVNISFWSRSGAQAGITTGGQSGPGSNCREEDSTLPRSLKLEPCKQMKLSVISRSPFWVAVLSLSGGYSQRVLNPPDRMAYAQVMLKELITEWSLRLSRDYLLRIYMSNH